MSALDRDQTAEDSGTPPNATPQETDRRTVHPCNFRASGRLSNENARALTAIHQAFVRQLTTALADYVGAEVRVELQTLDQQPLKTHIAAIPEFTYVASFPLTEHSTALTLDLDSRLIFPIIDRLLGGAELSADPARELSEIEEEIMQGVTLLIARHAEKAWGLGAPELAASARIEPALLQDVCPGNEKVTVIRFEVEVGGIAGFLQLMFPSTFAAELIKQSKQALPQKKGALRFFPAPGIRERILDCDVVVAADLPTLRIAVRDLVALQPGYVLKLRAPVRTPGRLTVGGEPIFESVPVRNGGQKAAQVGGRVQPASWGKE
jgi:flagellar motor switch protein FliM